MSKTGRNAHRQKWPPLINEAEIIDKGETLERMTGNNGCQQRYL
jgi:hypothetical protein